MVDGRKPAGPRHVCTKRTDFKKRRADQARQERERERKAAAAARKKTRQRNDRHDPDECEDEDCQAYGCVQFRRGFQTGEQVGYAIASAVETVRRGAAGR